MRSCLDKEGTAEGQHEGGRGTTSYALFSDLISKSIDL